MAAASAEDGADAANLWRNAAFVRLWAAATISDVGSFVTRTALPLAAIYVLKAGPLEIAALRGLEFVGYLLVGLIAGAWVDRLLRRPIMIGADLGRALLLGSIPIAAIAGGLSLPQLLLVTFFAATLSTSFNTASTAYLPTIIPTERLIRANSALSASASAAEFTGFGLGGFLVQVFTAPIAIAVDAVSYLCSAALLLTIRRPEPPRPAVHEREPVLREIRQGIGVVRRSPILLALMGAHAMNHVLWGVYGSVYLLFATGSIGLNPAEIGIISAIGGAGSFIGAAIAARVARRVGLGTAMILGLAGAVIGNAIIPVVPDGAVAAGIVLLIVQQLFGDSSGTIYEILEVSLTQTIVDGRILGRVNATVEFVTTLTALLGAVGGGIAAELIGLRGAMVLGILGAAIGVLFVWFSPVRSMREVPAAVDTASLRVDELPLTE
ncbi:MAG TPA: MFS transporter [Candidatus Limnocylindrales bacterium]|nr:MFS transporter [Candidatus Limnocylindrales bacterium]